MVAEALRCRALPSAVSVCPRSAADVLIRSAVDIFHPRQQGNTAADLLAADLPAAGMPAEHMPSADTPSADMPAASGLVRSIDILGSVNINGRVLD